MRLRALGWILICTVLIGLTLPLQAQHETTIEEAMNAVQERALATSGTPIQWPDASNTNSTTSTIYLPSGYYSNVWSSASGASFLVQKLADRVSNGTFLSNFVSTTTGDISGTTPSTLPLFTPSTIYQIPTITSDDYQTAFGVAVSNICRLKFIYVKGVQKKIESKETTNEGHDGSGGPSLTNCDSPKNCISAAHPSTPYGKKNIIDTSNCSSVSSTDYGPESQIRVDGKVSVDGSGYKVELFNSKGRIKADSDTYQGLTNVQSGVAWYYIIPTTNTASTVNPPPPSQSSGTITGSSGGLYQVSMASGGGTNWFSGILGDMDAKPAGGNCPTSGSPKEDGWSLDDSNLAIVIAPSFAKNIQNCSAPECSCKQRAAQSGGKCASCVAKPSAGSNGRDGGVSGFMGYDAAGIYGTDLNIVFNGPSGDNFTPKMIRISAAPDTIIISDSSGAPRQVKAYDTTANIVTINDSTYEIRFYNASQVGGPTSGLYTFTGDPFRTWKIENPNGAGNISAVKITDTFDGNDTVTQFAWDNASQQLTLATGNGTRKEVSTSVLSGGNRIETRTVKNSDNTVVSKEENTFQVFSWGEALTQKVVDPTGAALTNTWTYYTDPSTNGYRQVQQMIQSSGHWERYEYDSSGRTTKTVAQYLDSAVGSAESTNRVTTITYGSGDPAVTQVQTLLGQEVSRQYTVYRPGEIRQIQAQTSGAAWDNATNLVTITKTYLGGDYPGDIQSVENPDGTMSLYTYSLSSNQKTTTVKTGQPNGGKTDITDGTKVVTVTDDKGVQLSQNTYDIASTLFLTSSVTNQVDSLGRPTKIDYSDGTSESIAYDCCGISSKTDRDGTTTSYIYDDLKRPISTTRAGVTTLMTYDAEDRVLTTIRKGSDNSQITTDTSVYDLVGRRTSSTDALSNTTTYSETFDGSGHTVRTTTAPDGTTKIETSAKDGKLLSVSGTGAHPINYEYGVDSAGEFVKTIMVGTGGATTEWIKTYTDLAGRSYKTVAADGTVLSQSYFNGQGQLTKQVDGDGVATLFSYDGRGLLKDTAVDLNQNGTIDYAGTDRITRSVYDVLTDHGVTVQRTTTSVWPNNGVDSSTVISVNEASADGLQSWSAAFGQTNYTQLVHNGGGTNTVTMTAPDGTTTQNVAINGLLKSAATSRSGIGTLSSTTYTYDPHNRQSTATDGRVSTVTSFVYDNKDQIITNTVGSQVTAFVLNNMGELIRKVLPDGGTITNTYASTGELLTTAGARTYAQTYTFDPQGRPKTLVAGSGTTTWNYSSDRGLLTSKTYNDGNGPSYTYTPAGRLLTRTWARGITTSYSNDASGLLTSISYSTNSTSNISYSFDRRGRRIQSIGSTETNTMAYNDAGQMLTEIHQGGPLDGITVTNAYDGFLRRSLVGASSGAGSLASQTFGYDNASRLTSVTSGTNSVTYSYLANSSLLDTLAFKQGGVTRLTTAKAYDSLNRLTSVTNTPSTDSVMTFNYTYNNANQRTRNDLADGSRWEFQYDGLGQVTSGVKKLSDGTPVNGEQFGYAFDGIGNRTSTTVNGRSANYSANALNQYTTRDVPGMVDVLGTASTNAYVTVNYQSTVRQGEYFYKGLSVTNTSSAVYPAITAVGVVSGSSTNVADTVTQDMGNVFVPKTSESFSWDLDGNLTQDGRWTYQWDAENRLISMETRTDVRGDSSVDNSAKRKLDFVYDYQGRRIQKKSYIWNGSSYALSTTTKFVCDGWNCLAELNNGGTVLRSYVWGNDLSGSYQGAGGVGGLLAMNNTADSSSHFYAYDGNGNVAGLVNNDSGKLTAVYEYGPFGELLRQTGSASNINPFKFSTKEQDSESGLVYYGARYANTITGRWLSRDPIEEQGGINLYGFNVNNPVSNIDPIGFWTRDEWATTSGNAIACEGDTLRKLAILVTGNGNDAFVLQAGGVSADQSLKNGFKVNIIPLLRKFELRLRLNVVKATEAFPDGGFGNTTPKAGSITPPEREVNYFFEPGNARSVSTDCSSAALLVLSKGLIDTLRPGEFNSLGYSYSNLPLRGFPADPLRMKLGDLGYFKNYSDYLAKNPGGAFSGQNVIRTDKGWWGYPFNNRTVELWVILLKDRYGESKPPPGENIVFETRAFFDVPKIGMAVFDLRNKQ